MTGFPVLLGEAIEGTLAGRPTFPFLSWARANHFEYPKTASDFLRHCGSAAEAFFAREFVVRETPEYPQERVAVGGGLILELQARCGSYFIDALVNDGTTLLAVEIDGEQFHHRTSAQLAHDYLRERRIVFRGHTVVRFTAREVFGQPGECWQQVRAILKQREKQQ